MRKHYMNRHFKQLREEYWASNRPGGETTHQKTVANVKITVRRQQQEALRKRQLDLKKGALRKPLVPASTSSSSPSPA
jgi:hypothetical protein